MGETLCDNCRETIGTLLDEYAGRINERDYPDAVAALLRFRSEILVGRQWAQLPEVRRG